jgi:hypothetical protein
MPSQQQHAFQLERNQQACAQLNAQALLPDWVITMAFYAALHSIEQYLAKRGFHPTSHSRRAQLLDATPDLHLIKHEFMAMKNLSEQCRYLCYSPSTTDLNQQLTRLERINSHITKLL